MLLANATASLLFLTTLLDDTEVKKSVTSSLVILLFAPVPLTCARLIEFCSAILFATGVAVYSILLSFEILKTGSIAAIALTGLASLTVCSEAFGVSSVSDLSDLGSGFATSDTL